MTVGGSTSRRSKGITLLVCVTLLASLCNGACAFACAAGPGTPNRPAAHDTIPSHPHTESSGMVMAGNHDCCPHSSSTPQATPLQPAACPGLQAIAWKAVEATPLVDGNSPAYPAQPNVLATASLLFPPRVTDRRWPPGSSRMNWLSPTGFTPKITQLLV